MTKLDKDIVKCYNNSNSSRGGDAQQKDKEEKAMGKVDIVTGFRPTGDLTVANFLGAVDPIVKFQNQGYRCLIFVADLHALTDHEPATVRRFTNEVVADYIALGIDPRKTKIYKQSDIEGEVTALMTLLARHISVAELLRVPTLKDKLRGGVRPETANTLLLLYPVLMAADILLQRARRVPVGEDQLAHLEVARKLARRFNKKYGKVFPVPTAFALKSLRVLSLKGAGKMSKTSPEGAIFLTDDPQTVARKIKGAETAFEGKMNERLKSHILLAKSLCKTGSDRRKIDALVKEHKRGKPVMGQFKQLFTRITQDFLAEFQSRRAKVTKNPSYIPSVLVEGRKIARTNAIETMEIVKQAFVKFYFV